LEKIEQKKQALYVKTYIHLYKYLVSDEIGTKIYGTAGGAEEKVANLNTEIVYKHAVFFSGTQVKNQKTF
jgi:hypothetical protein